MKDHVKQIPEMWSAMALVTFHIGPTKGNNPYGGAGWVEASEAARVVGLQHLQD